MKIKRKILLIIITNIMIFFTFATSSYAKLESFLYENNSREYYYILKDDFSEIGSDSPIENYINEDIYQLRTGPLIEPDVVNEDTFPDTMYFYYWLHGVSDMINYIEDEGIDYQTLSAESEDNLNAAINVLQFAKHELGTFTVADRKDLPTDLGVVFGDDRVTQKKTRSATAYGDITRYRFWICGTCKWYNC